MMHIQGPLYPSIPLLMRAVRRTRLLSGMKQSHLAELLGVGQASVSKWESGRHVPAPEILDRLARFVAEPPQTPSDAILKRLVEQSARPMHLICDATHRLLAASQPRRSRWRLADNSGVPMWPYATPEIRQAEETLASIGWTERADSAVFFETSGSAHPVVSIDPSTVLWERLHIGDHGWARLVTTLGPAELPPATARPV
jgi:transcriptional regulator with XRE-family HTH domain